MMLYTVIPACLLFPPQTPAAGRWQEMGGRMLLLRETAGGQVVDRLVSTDPADYLRPGWQPGSSFRP